MRSQTGSVSNPWLFTGRQFDQESGLYFYRNRYYEPRAGRFITRDPAGFIDGANLYTYVKNNPVNLVDPYGLASWPLNKAVEKIVKEKLKEIPDIPLLPGKNREETINEIAKEVGDKISNKDAFDAKSGKKLEQIKEDLLEKLEEAHPDWPWDKFEKKMGELLGIQKKNPR